MTFGSFVFQSNADSPTLDTSAARGGITVTRFFGVDPGFSGALAVVETVNSIPVLVD